MKKKHYLHEPDSIGGGARVSMRLTENSALEDPKVHSLLPGPTFDSNAPQLPVLKPEEIKLIGSLLPKDAPSNIVCEEFSDVSGTSQYTDTNSMCDSGRPSSMSSWASSVSSRTSRNSDYFNAPCSSDHHLTSHHSSMPLLHQLSSTVDNNFARNLAQFRVEVVAEEDETEAENCKQDAEMSDGAKHESGFCATNNSASFNNSKHEKRVSVRDINKKLSEVDLRSPIASGAMLANPKLTYMDRIILELLETERMYVRALEDILAGYFLAMKNSKELPISAEDLETLFANIKDIYVFNRKFLAQLENSRSDPVEIAECFISKGINFDVYTQYCTNYPQSVTLLTRCMKNPTLTEFFKIQQTSLQHTLPLGSYLLKPVQRILKYHLILQEMVKSCNKSLDGYDLIEKALATMTQIAHHINEMKRKHEDTVRIQEIQSLLINWEGDDLMTCGDLVKEGDMKLHGARGERRIFLFDKLIMITKQREDGFFVCKYFLKCSDLMLLESVADDLMSFIILGFNEFSQNHLNPGSKTSGKLQHKLSAKSAEDKNSWTYEIKRLIMKHHHTTIPLKAQQSILNSKPAPSHKGTIDRKKGPWFSRGSLSHEEGKHKHPLTRLGSTVSASVINIQEKVRKRSEPSKSPAAIKVGANLESSGEDKVSFSVPSTPSAFANETARFSFSSSPTNTAVHSQNKLNINCETSTTTTNVTEVDNKSSEPEAKPSVVYRRHKRRISQPITFIERRESAIYSDDVNIPDNNEENGDDLLNFKLGCRESVSWDVQIVDAVFNRFRHNTPPITGSRDTAPGSVRANMNKDLPNLLAHAADASPVKTTMNSEAGHEGLHGNEQESNTTMMHLENRLKSSVVKRKQDQLETTVPISNNVRPKSLGSTLPTNTNLRDVELQGSVRPASYVNVSPLQSGSASVTLMPWSKSNISSSEDFPSDSDVSVAESEVLTIMNGFASSQNEMSSVDIAKLMPMPISCESNKSEARRRYLERLRSMRGRYHANSTRWKDTKAIPSGIVKGLLTKHDLTAQSGDGTAVPHHPKVDNTINAQNVTQQQDFSADHQHSQHLHARVHKTKLPAVSLDEPVGLQQNKAMLNSDVASTVQLHQDCSVDEQQKTEAENAVQTSSDNPDTSLSYVHLTNTDQSEMCSTCQQLQQAGLHNKTVALCSCLATKPGTSSDSGEREKFANSSVQGLGRAMQTNKAIHRNRDKSNRRRHSSCRRSYTGRDARGIALTSTKVKELTQKFDRLSKCDV